MKQYQRGLEGEQAAEKWLCEHGMTCLDRRYRAEDGELDLVMRQDDLIIFVEVKYRPGGRRGEGMLAVTANKQRRMTHAAMAWLVHHGMMDRSARFDVIEITRDGVCHVPNAFMALM